MTTISVKDGSGSPVSVNTLPANDGTKLPVDTVVAGAATDRGAIIGFTGAQLTTTASSTAATLTTNPTSGSLAVGQVVVGTGIPAGTTIAAINGTAITLSIAATASGTGVAITSVGPQQLMAANGARRLLAYQNQGSTAKVWVNGTAGATADYHSLLIPPGAYYDTPPQHVSTGAISVISDTPATPLYAREA